jgi:hypothetical protein
MSADVTSNGLELSGRSSNPGIIWKVKQWLVSTEREFSFVRGLTFLGFFGTLIAAYFQYLSAYQDKVAAQAKEDLAAATSTFTETSNALSTAITLQADLFHNFVRAKGDNDQSALLSQTANDMYKPYESASDSLRQNINVFARKVEIYLDWPSDSSHNPADRPRLGLDPISTSMLGYYDFDCDTDMPTFDPAKSPYPVTKNGKVLDVDWFSARHHVLTIGYCFYVTHVGYMEIIRQWSARSTVNADDIAKFFKDDRSKVLQARLDSEVVRLNAFMTLAMDEIDRIRARYEPNGFVCHVPIVSEALSLIAKRCKPI